MRNGRPVEVRTDANVFKHILTEDFGIKNVCAKIVSTNLSEEQKLSRMSVANQRSYGA